jgi:hypothetical protein
LDASNAAPVSSLCSILKHARKSIKLQTIFEAAPCRTFSSILQITVHVEAPHSDYNPPLISSPRPGFWGTIIGLVSRVLAVFEVHEEHIAADQKQLNAGSFHRTEFETRLVSDS